MGFLWLQSNCRGASCAPVGLAGSTPAYPIFITQHALDAVHAQLVELPDGASSIGFLVGEIYQTPDTHARYILVESTIHVPWSIGGDHLAAALRQGQCHRRCRLSCQTVARLGACAEGVPWLRRAGPRE